VKWKCFYRKGCWSSGGDQFPDAGKERRSVGVHIFYHLKSGEKVGKLPGETMFYPVKTSPQRQGHPGGGRTAVPGFGGEISTTAILGLFG
jgi:hypothetical protein